MSTVEFMIPSPASEARVFAALQRRLLLNRLWDQWTRNRLRFLVVGTLSIVFWCVVFYLFIEGFDLLRNTIVHVPTRVAAVHSIFNVFFLSLLVMITVSSSVIFFSTAYRGRDIPMLLVQPVRPRRVALLKAQEALVFGGWGFFLLGSPMLWAYGVTVDAPWYYYVAVIPFMLAFVAIPVALGTILCLLTIRLLPRYHRQVLIGACAILVIAGGAFAWSIVQQSNTSEAFTLEWLERTLGRLKLSEQQLLPSWWLSSGLLEAAHPAQRGHRVSWRESLGFFIVLVTNALLLFLLIGRIAEKFYARGYSEITELSRPGATLRSEWLDRFTHNALFFVPTSVRVLYTKDLRVFSRDILQWSQFAVFAGLLGIYFLNIRRLQAGAQFASWIVAIGFLNIGVVGLLWATFTTRFVYPLLSLEGRRFWILRTAPVRPSSILWSKFAFAITLGILPCGLLIWLSDLMLGMSVLGPWIMVVHQITSLALCCGLSGIAVGLGAWLPNLQESAPAKIATGFGGTLSLVLSVVFIVVTVLATAIPVWLWIQTEFGYPTAYSRRTWLIYIDELTGMVLSILFTVALGAIATWLPLYVGLKAFERLEP